MRLAGENGSGTGEEREKGESIIHTKLNFDPLSQQHLVHEGDTSLSARLFGHLNSVDGLRHHETQMCLSPSKSLSRLLGPSVQAAALRKRAAFPITSATPTTPEGT